MDPIFVRAKPKKISVKETYHYEVVVGDHRDWQFDRSEGEIAIEFLYDGHHNGFFSADAREDVKVQDPDEQACEAQVGHLAIVKAGQTVWKILGCEGKTFPVRMNVKGLQRKLESSQKLIVKYLYRPDEPESTSIILGDVLLTDKDPILDYYRENPRLESDPYLILDIEFIMSPLPSELIEVSGLSQDKVQLLCKAGQAAKREEMKFLPGGASSEHIYNELLTLAKSDQGGFVFIGAELGESIEGLSESEEDSLPSRVMEAALRYDFPIPVTKPFITSIGSDDDEKRLGLVVLMPGLKDRFTKGDTEDNIWVDRDTSISEDLITELTEKEQEQEVVFIDIDADVDELELASTFVALANTQGGYILFGKKGSPHKQNPQIIGMTVEETHSQWTKIKSALRSVKPALWDFCRHNLFPLERPDGETGLVLALQVFDDLREVYSFRRRCWRREHGKNIELDPQSTFELFAQRYETYSQKVVYVGELPRIAFGYLEWPYTVLDSDAGDNILPGATSACKHKDGHGLTSKDANIYMPSKYDPARGALEWHEVWFSRERASLQSHNYEARLRQRVNNPKELWQTNGTNRVREYLTGHFDISLGSKLLSGLEVQYYDAQGRALSDEIFSHETIIALDLKLRAGEMFEQHKLLPHRHLEFDGVRPERARYKDIKEALQDLGLRIIYDDYHGRIFQRRVTLQAEGRLEDGRYFIILVITNLRYSIKREVSYGERIDTGEIPSGRMIIDIVGRADSPDTQKLTELLNQLQEQLKERFRYVKVS